jgi:PKD repeat protein
MKIKHLLFLAVTCFSLFLSSKAQNLHPVNTAGDNLLATIAFELPTPIISVNGSVPASGQKAESCFSNNNFAFAANNISGTVSYVWDFGDGGATTSATPTHSYTVAGIYKVTLTVTDGITTTTANQFVEVSPKPVAAFNVYAGAGNGNAYSFQSSSTVASGSIANYIWDFGDGSGAVTSNPDKVYAAAGNYSVKLIVVSDKGCRDTITKTVVVTLTGSPIVAAFTSNAATQCLATNSFVFTNTSDNGNGETYAWNFGDGTSSTSYSPTHTYTQAGNYTVTLTVTKGANSSVAVKAITVASQPVSSFGFTVNNNVVNFTSSSTITTGYITNFNWDFGNGSTSTLQSPIHTFAASNTYLVTLTATGIGGCTGASSQNVTVVVPPSVSTNVSAFTVSAAQCLKNNGYQFTNGSVVTGTNISYSWNFNDGTTSTLVSPTHTFTAAGSYNVILTVTSSAGTSVSNQNVVVYPQPVPSFTIANTGSAYTFINTSTIASGAIASAVWTSSDGNGFTGNQYNQTFAPGNYTVKLVATSDNGCSEEITQIIAYATPISANFSISGTALTSCFDNTNNYTFTNSSTTGAGISYLWEFGDGTTSTSYSPSHQYATSGSYIVRLRVSDGSQSVYATPQVIALNPKPAPEFLLYLNTTLTSLSSEVKRCFTPGMDFSFMSSSTVAFGQMHYKWSFATNAIRFRDGDSLDYINPRIVFDTAGIYPVKLVVSTDKGCTDSVIHVIKLGHPHAHHLTKVDFGGDKYANPTVTFTDDSYDHKLAINTWQWNFGNGSSSALQNPTPFQYTCGGTYNIALRIIDEIPCTSDTGSVVIIRIRPRAQFAISAPNYTPDVYAKPTFTFTNNTTVNDGCPNLTYAWNFGDGYTSTNSNPTHIFKGSGVYNVRLIATNQNGGEKDTLIQQVTVAIKPKAIFSTNQSLVPDIYASPTVNIVNTTSSADTAAPASALQYAWDFGDGNTANVKNPTGHVYAAGGTYTITLTVTNPISGLVDVITRNVTVVVKPKAQFTVGAAVFSPDVYATPSYTFTNSSTVNDANGNLTYSWNFGDGSAVSTATSPSHVYTTSGTYTVTLVVTNQNGSATDTRTATVTVVIKPKASFTANLTYDVNGRPVVTVSNNSSVTETPVPTLTYSWTYGDGVGVSTSASPSAYTYTTGAASRTVTLIVTNTNGGATDTYSVTLNNVYIKPIAAFTKTVTDMTVDYNASTTVLNDGSGTLSYSWNFGDGSAIATGVSGSHTYTAEGNYTITLTATNSNGNTVSTATTSVSIVAPTPVARINISSNFNGTYYDIYFAASGAPSPAINSSISSGTIVNYNWVLSWVYLQTGTAYTNFYTTNSSSFSFSLNGNAEAPSDYDPSHYQLSVTLTATSDFGKTNVASATYVYGTAAVGYTPYRSSVLPSVNVPRERTFINSSNVLVYPNPATSEITVKYTSPILGDISILIYDLHGKIVDSRKAVCSRVNSLINTKIAVSALSKGMYIVKVLNQNGRLIGTSQFLKGQ